MEEMQEKIQEMKEKAQKDAELLDIPGMGLGAEQPEQPKKES